MRCTVSLYLRVQVLLSRMKSRGEQRDARRETATEHKRSGQEEEMGWSVGGVDSRDEKSSCLYPTVCCLSSLWGVSGIQKMGSSKEDQDESVLALLTEIKRLRRALPSRIMEYGISHPAQDSHNENGREICWQPCSRIIHSPIQHVPLFFATHCILQSKVTFCQFCLPNSVISFHFTSSLNPSSFLKDTVFPFFTVKGEQSEQILLCVHSNISPLECWKINNPPTIQGQQDNRIKEGKRRGVWRMR